MHTPQTPSRIIRLPWLTWLVAFVIWMIVVFVARGEPRREYETGYANLEKIALDLYAALDPAKQRQISQQPVADDSLSLPFAAPSETAGGGQTRRVVKISKGFVGLINQIAHARAVSTDKHPFLARYSTTLAESGSDFPPPAWGLPEERVWHSDTLNLQASQFNQMAGAVIAIGLAHHYLGHYEKYAARLQEPQRGGQPIPITSVLTEKEWRDAVVHGARNALNCGLGVDGLCSLFACIEAMPARPAWTAYFAPPKAKLSKITRDLKRLEDDFFVVGK